MIKSIKTQQRRGKTWYSWVEICDKCGKTIQSHNVLCSEPPKENEVHFCVGCMRYLLDNCIPYDVAKKTYGTTKEG